MKKIYWVIFGKYEEHLALLIYINDVSADIVSTVKLFADDKLLFSITPVAKTTVLKLNKHLQNIAEWVH